MSDDRRVHVTALVHAYVTILLAGVGWVVQVVVYPAFALVPADRWEGHHAAHSHRIALVVGPPWVVQGVSTVVLLLLDPVQPLVIACAVAAAAGVVLTFGAVRDHDRLAAGVDGPVLASLLRWNLARSLVWTVGGVLALVLGGAAGAGVVG